MSGEGTHDTQTALNNPDWRLRHPVSSAFHEEWQGRRYFWAGPDLGMASSNIVTHFDSGLSFPSGEPVDRFVKAAELLCNPYGCYCSFCYCEAKTTAVSI